MGEPVNVDDVDQHRRGHRDARLTHTAGFDEPGLHDPEVQKSYYYVDVGLIAGNVYLFAAAHGLAAWFHNCDRAGLTEHLGLKVHQRVLFAQSVGYLPAD
ncbi:hypothetical protein A5713_08445 [Mycobacterium sp. E2497]|nr:hypothetical protein A5713_08445 [Mycobacterium sp. E2497]